MYESIFQQILILRGYIMYNKEKIMKVLHDIKGESDTIAPYVIVAQPRRSKDSLIAQKINGNLGLHIDFSGFSHGYVESVGHPVDVARNYLIQQVLDTDAEYLFFVGDDTVSPWDAFKILHKTSQENPDAIITGVYYVKLSNAMIMIRQDNKIIVPNVDPGQVFEAWQTGMDCMLIPVRILREMYEAEPELPFCCIANGIEGLPFIGEDNFFVHRVRKHGFRLLVNTDVQCLHMDVHSGKYTAHPDVDLNKYFTNIPITEHLTMADKRRIDETWIQSLPRITENEDESISN
jgi:hypothetical protein